MWPSMLHRVLFVVVLFGGLAHADTQLPASVASLPAKPKTEIHFENYGHTAFKVTDGTAEKELVVAGKHW